MNDLEKDGMADRAQKRILLVEDNRAASRALTKLLEARGYEVLNVSDGTSALAALRDGKPPDFLLTDLHLPDLDGLEIARQASQLDCPPRVALITGWDLDPLQRDFDRLGIEWVFTKPLDVQDLIDKLLEPPRRVRKIDHDV